jgi:hypothetical protein
MGTKRQVPFLFILWALFVFRVVAQLIQRFYPVAFLPSFSRWQSGLLPYPLLVFFQIVIASGLFWVALRQARGTSEPSLKKGKILIGLGTLYAGAMAVRYGAHMIRFPEHRWLGGTTIPIFFHFVLAGFLLAWGGSEFRSGTSNPEA